MTNAIATTIIGKILRFFGKRLVDFTAETSLGFRLNIFEGTFILLSLRSLFKKVGNNKKIPPIKRAMLKRSAIFPIYILDTPISIESVVIRIKFTLFFTPQSYTSKRSVSN